MALCSAGWLLGMVAAETRGRVAAQQVAGSLPWVGVDDPSDVQRPQAEHTVRIHRLSNFELGVTRKTHPCRRFTTCPAGAGRFGGPLVRG